MANQDKLQLFPSQDADHRPDECVAYTVSDIIGNIYLTPCDPGFVYGATQHLMDVLPNEGGTDPLTGMQSAIIYGCLPTTDETFTALTSSDLQEANFANYPASQRAQARQYTANGIKVFLYYQDVVNFLNENVGGVALAVRWYESFNTPNADGTLPQPSGDFSYHFVAAYEACPQGLRIKSWQGKIGDGGYLYMNEAIFNNVMYACYAFDPQMWRWLTIAQIALGESVNGRVELLQEILPLLS